jgi:hypothetical protein
MLLQNHKGDPIEDEALLNKQNCLNWKNIPKQKTIKTLQEYATGILADDVLYRLGMLYDQARTTGRSKKTLRKNHLQPCRQYLFYDVAGSCKLRGDFETDL